MIKRFNKQFRSRDSVEDFINKHLEVEGKSMVSVVYKKWQDARTGANRYSVVGCYVTEKKGGASGG